MRKLKSVSFLVRKFYHCVFNPSPVSNSTLPHDQRVRERGFLKRVGSVLMRYHIPKQSVSPFAALNHALWLGNQVLYGTYG